MTSDSGIGLGSAKLDPGLDDMIAHDGMIAIRRNMIAHDGMIVEY